QILAGSASPSVPTLAIPPVGNQPVFAARRSSKSPSSTSGIASKSAVKAPPVRSIQPSRCKASRIPQGSAAAHARSVARPVSSSVLCALGHRREPTVLATLLAWAAALPWGILEALHRDGWIDRTGGALTALLLAIPDVLLGLLLLLLAAKTGWFPTGGMASVGTEGDALPARIWDVGRHLFLPVLALVLGTLPLLARHVRSAMIVALE